MFTQNFIAVLSILIFQKLTVFEAGFFKEILQVFLKKTEYCYSHAKITTYIEPILVVYISVNIST